MIYADYNGSAPLLPSVREHLKRRLDSELFANPGAIHSMGLKVMNGIEKCRGIIAAAVGCFPDQLYFNSGSSEGVTTIIHSVLANSPSYKKVIITSPIEHVVIHTALDYFSARHGFMIKKVQMDVDGVISLESLKRLLSEYKGKIALATIMAANNETGVMQPYAEIAKLCRDSGVEFFSDTTQLIGKGDFDFGKSGMDYAACSGHKLGALTGTGFIMIKEPTKFQPLIFGKSQERGLRGGTQHYLGIETVAVAFQDFMENKHKLNHLREARNVFEKQMKSEFPEVTIIGGKSDRLAGTTLIGYPGIHGQAVQIELESSDIFVTTSAACSDNQPETSVVLKSMGVDDQLGRSVIRISLSYSHGEREYSALALALKNAYNKLRKIHSF
ncbi:MAG TPA: aminotransferase class V-fold PLP-dependent enzyme [Bacteriovoracaceae bacterium]|nr:aminotransferase class V-fold PLP-dependent enzyme [Bacteriovoracaceae bacterium]